MKLDEYLPPSLCIAYSFGLGHYLLEKDQKSVLQLKTSLDETSSFTILKSGKCVEVICVVIQQKIPNQDHNAPFFLPIYPLCLQLANQFINSIETSLLMD